MNKEQLASLLNGREIDNEITSAECAEAKKNALVVVYGYSDDTCMFAGAITDSFDCDGGGEIYLNRNGLFESHYEGQCSCQFCGFEAAKAKAAKIEAVWCKDGYPWTYKTAIPHATFDVMEDGEKYCRGIVFAVADLPE